MRIFQRTVDITMIKCDGDCSDHGIAQRSGRVDVKRSRVCVV
jgi:hypothetical protein